ncbi:UNVERIFIED_CONTAM: helix-turn-helix transcriptional regulator, partial [Salmonella enterica subsp. enterica serovar Weltevreden]
ELKVVELVRAGLKNKDIAGRVFVSLRTVELRLTAAYRKLGVGSRTELVSLLAGNPRLAAV